MKHTLIAALSLFVSASPVVAAQDVEVIANSVLMAYSNSCDPLAFDQYRPAGGNVDSWLVLSYGQELLVRYGADCGRFAIGEVLGAIAVPDLLGRLPALQQPRPQSLSEVQIALLAYMQRYDDFTDRECAGVDNPMVNLSQWRSLVGPWWKMVGRDDAFTFAKAYVGSENASRIMLQIPTTADRASQCKLRDGVALVAYQAAVNSGLIQPEARPVEPVTEEQQALEARKAVDLLAGSWRFADDPDGCADVSGGQAQVTIGAAERADNGGAVPEAGQSRIDFHDFGCLLQPTRIFGGIEVDAQCMGTDGNRFSGSGEITVLDADYISLQLPTEESQLASGGAMDLRRCPVPQSPASSASTEDNERPVDLFGD